MDWETIVFEKGVEVHFAEGSWSFSPHDSRHLGSLQECLAALSPLRPLLLRRRNPEEVKFNVIARSDGRRIMEFAVSELRRTGLTERNVAHVHGIFHNVSGALYHFHEMAEAYARITSEHALDSARVGGADISGRAGDPGVYFEFEAFVSSIRRAYDSMRYTLWQRYEEGSGSVPRSLEALLNRSRNLPENLRARLSTSWANFGVPITAYRDCLHHYVPLTEYGAPLLLKREHLGAWTLLARVPDNPAARAARLFTFERGLDALTYSYDCLDEVINMATIAAESLGSNAMAPLDEQSGT